MWNFLRVFWVRKSDMWSRTGRAHSVSTYFYLWVIFDPLCFFFLFDRVFFTLYDLFCIWRRMWHDCRLGSNYSINIETIWLPCWNFSQFYYHEISFPLLCIKNPVQLWKPNQGMFYVTDGWCSRAPNKEHVAFEKQVRELKTEFILNENMKMHIFA